VELQARFLSIMPRIRTHARIYFRHIKCHGRRADCIAEAIALAWKWFIRLAEKGKDATRFPSVLASYAARAVRSGRRVCGQLKAKDAMSEVAQQRHGFTVTKLPDISTLDTNPYAEALADNTQTEVPEQVQFRCDHPAWVASHADRDRRLIHQMMLGHRTMDLARRFRLSPARISQLRAEYKDDWEEFCGEPALSA
jgi:hypothetical protein